MYTSTTVDIAISRVGIEHSKTGQLLCKILLICLMPRMRFGLPFLMTAVIQESEERFIKVKVSKQNAQEGLGYGQLAIIKNLRGMGTLLH